MNNFDLGSMLTRLASSYVFTNRQTAAVSQATAQSFAQNVQSNIAYQTTADAAILRMNTLQSMDMAIYVREVMQLPNNLNELVYMIQKNVTLTQFNQMFSQQTTAQKNALSQTQAQILAQLQGMALNTQSQTLTAAQLQSAIKNLSLSANNMINLTQIGQLIQVNGKEALTKLITAMAAASQNGISDLSQIKEMARLINANIAAASQNDPAQTLRALMLLYLPWLPLEEGVGFDLDIETSDNGVESDSILTINISTVNYGVVAATLVLETSNSVHVAIECSKEFPKDELLARIQGEQEHYSMNSVVTFSAREAKSEEQTAKAKINMSQTTEINPYMLLMAHTLIRHTIEIDNNKSIGVTSHID